MTMCCPTRALMSSIWMISIALEALSTTRRSTRDDGRRVILLVRGAAAALAGSATEIDAARMPVCVDPMVVCVIKRGLCCACHARMTMTCCNQELLHRGAIGAPRYVQGDR